MAGTVVISTESALFRLRLAEPTAGRRTLDDVALACGFTDDPSFTSAFRRRFGLSTRDARAS